MFCDFHFNKEMFVSMCMHVQTCLSMPDVELLRAAILCMGCERQPAAVFCIMLIDTELNA